MERVLKNDTSEVGAIRGRPVVLQFGSGNQCCCVVNAKTSGSLRVLVFEEWDAALKRTMLGPETGDIVGSPGATLRGGLLVTASYGEDSRRLVLVGWRVAHSEITRLFDSGHLFGTPGGSADFAVGLDVFALKDAGGKLKVFEFHVDQGLAIHRQADAEAGPIIDNPGIAYSRKIERGSPDVDGFIPFAMTTTAVQAADGKLKVINWQHNINRFTRPPPNDDTLLEVPRKRIDRKGDNGSGGQTGVFGRPAIIARPADGKVVTAVNTESGVLVLTVYQANLDGGISFVENEVLAINERVLFSPSLAFAQGASGGTEFASAVTLQNGALRVDYWSLAPRLRHLGGSVDGSFRGTGSPTIAPARAGEAATGEDGFFVALRLEGADQLYVTKWRHRD